VLLEQKFDHILYTGGGAVGRIVMAAAAKHLTPVTLELGGKGPAIVTASADLDVASSAIIFGRYCNAGQICLASDYLLVEEQVYDKFLTTLLAAIKTTFGSDPIASPAFGRLCTDRHFDRVSALLDKTKGKILVGGQRDASARFIAPTVVALEDADDPLMHEEIFGPILPVLRVSSVNEAIAFVNARDKPLALYLFSTNAAETRHVMESTSSGSAAVNATLLQTISPGAWLGGVGPSGTGAYGFERGFQTYSHMRPVEYVSTFRSRLVGRLTSQVAYNSESTSKPSWLEKALRFYFGMHASPANTVA
jgi:aldehyde dehydrogenase (NAD+)